MAEIATAFAPASIGNMAVGFDMLGLAIAGVGDRVSAERIERPGVEIATVRGLDGDVHPDLPADPKRNTASIAAQAFWTEHGDRGGIRLSIFKGVPLQSGMGSSAASAVAAVVAANALLAQPLALEKLLRYTLEGEKFASGGLHADNVAPSLLGGLVFCPPTLYPDMFRLPLPTGIRTVLLHPELQVNTAESRKGLATTVSCADWLAQQSYLGGFIAACATDDHALLGRTLKDVIIEPQRAAAVSCFPAVRDAAMQAGALGCSLSGSGPSIFALIAERQAGLLASAMERSCYDLGIDCQVWISDMDAPGAHVEA